MHNVLEHQRAIRLNILKSFGHTPESLEKSMEDEIDPYELSLYKSSISSEELDWFEKARHQVGDMHPNGKWVWKEIRPGVFDWRNANPAKRGRKPAAAAGAAPDGGGGDGKSFAENAVKLTPQQQEKIADRIKDINTSLWQAGDDALIPKDIDSLKDIEQWVQKLEKKDTEASAASAKAAANSGKKLTPIARKLSAKAFHYKLAAALAKQVLDILKKDNGAQSSAQPKEKVSNTPSQAKENNASSAKTKGDVKTDRTGGSDDFDSLKSAKTNGDVTKFWEKRLPDFKDDKMSKVLSDSGYRNAFLQNGGSRTFTIKGSGKPDIRLTVGIDGVSVKLGDKKELVQISDGESLSDFNERLKDAVAKVASTEIADKVDSSDKDWIKMAPLKLLPGKSNAFMGDNDGVAPFAGVNVFTTPMGKARIEVVKLQGNSGFKVYMRGLGRIKRDSVFKINKLSELRSRATEEAVKIRGPKVSSPMSVERATKMLLDMGKY